MFQYIIKRLLIMIPTLFVIALLVFIVLNLAPGKPGSQQNSGEGSLEAQDNEAREAYKIFKEQFNLDKPIIFNSRYNLDEKDISTKLDIIADKETNPQAKLDAIEALEDWGNYTIKPLILMLAKEKNLHKKELITKFLSLNAQQKIKSKYGKILTKEQREYNTKAYRLNQYLKTLTYKYKDPKSKKEKIEKLWINWYKKNKQQYEFDFWQKVKIFFLDTRFAKYMNNLLMLDFGVSHVDKKPVLGKIFHKLRYSFFISFSSILLAYLISIPIGIFSAVKQNTLPDRVITLILFMLYALPSFFVGTLLLKFFTGQSALGFFPVGGFTSPDYDNLSTLSKIGDIVHHCVLPIICMTYLSLAALSRYARTGLLEVIKSDYIRTARAKGLPEKVVIIRHAARNGMIPILTLLASLLPILIGGSVVIEYIFNIPGMGTYIIESINTRDYNSIMGIQIMVAFLTLFGILLSDISYAIVDPRITYK